MIKNKKLTLTFILLVLSFMLFVGVSLAWFAISQNTPIGLPLDIKSINVDYEYYLYQDDSFSGSNHLSLSDHLCLTETDELCYLQQTEPETIATIQGEKGVYPSATMSFAIKVINTGDTDGSVTITLSQLSSIGYLLEANKLQTAMQYSVTKVSYVNNNIEGADIKDSAVQAYAGDGSFDNHFTSDDSTNYTLLTGLTLNQSSTTSEAIIYFDLTFDPLISGVDELGQPTNNSNPFMGQSFSINKVRIIFS